MSQDFVIPAKAGIHGRCRSFGKASIFVRCRGRVAFSLLAQRKSHQKEMASSTEQSGDRNDLRDFRTRHPWLGPKTADIHVRRPSGLESAPALLQKQSNLAAPFSAGCQRKSQKKSPTT